VNKGKSVLLLLAAFSLAGQPSPPGRGPGAPPPRGSPPPQEGIEDVRRRLAGIRPTDEIPANMIGLAKLYLKRSESQEPTFPFVATRYLAVADALERAAEHQQALAQEPSQKSGPPPPDRAGIMDRIGRVYFRLRQADYFVEQSADPNAGILAGYARHYYELALRGASEPDLRIADECVKSTEDLMRALESLAQAAAPPRPPPPPPPPPPSPPKQPRDQP
jgi:hypothetical protein